MLSVEAYLQKLSSAQRAELEHIRSIIRKTAPDAEEVISYGMPGFKYKGNYLAGYAAFKDHLSFFPTSEPIEVFKGQLADFLISRGTIQFTPEHRIPDELIQQIIRRRLTSINQ